MTEDLDFQDFSALKGFQTHKSIIKSGRYELFSIISKAIQNSFVWKTDENLKHLSYANNLDQFYKPDQQIHSKYLTQKKDSFMKQASLPLSWKWQSQISKLLWKFFSWIFG